MKCSLFLVGMLFAMSNITNGQPQSRDSYPRRTKALKYVAEGFEPVDCFAGQGRVHGKRIVKQLFSVVSPNGDKKCCGSIVRSARTDAHGHFLVEPLAEGEYFAEFEFKGARYIASFAIIENYQHCDGTHVEVNFSDVDTFKIRSFVDIDDSGDECQENEPRCYRK